MIIETERLILRPIEIGDAKDVFEYSKEENVGPNAGWKPHESMEETMELMKIIFMEQEGVFGIALKEDNKIIGSIGLIQDPKRENSRTRMLGYAISQKYWGQGIMTEAAKKMIEYGFETMGLDLISAYCYPHNQRSKGVIKKCGFTYEGTLKLCEELYDGNIYGNECYAICKK